MSSPETRLISDDVAEGILRDADSILAAHLPNASMELRMAVYILALLRDRDARQEIAAQKADCGQPAKLGIEAAE